MSIFSSKKAKAQPRQIDVDKSKPQAATNGAKSQPNGSGFRNGAASAIGTAALSAGARTIQRAQIMAASRKRMNGETPDYSIEGAAKSNGPGPKSSVPSSMSVKAAKQAVQGGKSNGTAEPKSKSSHTRQKLSKSEPQSNDKRDRAVSMNSAARSGATTPIYAPLQTSGKSTPVQKPSSAGNTGTTNGSTLAVQKPPLGPMDSPTLGYDGSFTKPEPTSAAPSNLATSLTNVNTQGQPGSNAAQDIRIGRLSRNDSGFVSKPSASKDSSHNSKTSKGSISAEKPIPIHPGVRAESKASDRSSRSSTFISKLDPGPSGSTFAEPVESPRAISSPTGEEVNQRPRQSSRPQKFQLPEGVVRKETGTAAGQVSPSAGTPMTTDTSAKGLNRIVAASQAQPAPSARSSAAQSRKTERPFAQRVRSSTPPPVKSPAIVSPLEGTPRTYTLPAASPPVDEGAYRTAPTSKSNTPPQSRDSKDRSAPSIRPSFESMTMSKAAESYFGRGRAPPPEVQITNPGLPQAAPTRSSISERPALPPVSVLEGFKVNKRGQILDEEGEVIGELFEGDLIDCVRQKVDANGDILDESGVSVGRARTIIKGTIMAPRWSISSGVSLPLSTYNWGRRGSTSSQQTQQTHQTYQSQQATSTFFNRPTASAVSPPPVAGNAIVAELDGSTEVEAFPLIDQSEIFSPFGAAPRSESPSAMTNRSGLTADERSNSASSKTDARRESVSPDPPITKPVRKWTSRYFESNPLEGQVSPRRNSATPDMVQSRASQSSATPKTTSIYGGVSQTKGRAVIGMTLESLMEQDPSLFTKPEKANFGGSTPNLPLEGSKMGSTTPRPASTQFGAPAAGLGSRLSVNKGGYQPARRSPLGSYESSPPGSGGGPEDDKARARSLPPAARRTQRAAKASMEAEDAAPAPEISRRKWQERRALLSPADAEKPAERRKSRFSFMIPNKKEVAAA